ncbi:carbon-nitrogen hydrolase family protein [Streptomyces gibsoniae]|uniref:Carbon-nitrogen hydrolase family protein n=1 Tax=Streptomyces gibsoniae TaxID=3075529 RepID=A0ABU2U9P9_9ACTN|nr:carbon-nitrogen hydrolase family protein [Streptomyces sp. DSM 41699]MDT0469971.1 carbon-nitrogen hydrolase family protein [Streptomyces sp. DSM 41699]
MSVLDVVALQLAAEPGNVAGNVERLLDAVRAHGRGSDLVVTPELVTTGYDLDMFDERGAELAEPLDGPTVSAVAKAAAQLGTTIVLGILERDGEAVYDTAAVVLPDGSVYPFRKTHLYPAEVPRFSAGQGLLTVDTPAARIGPLICFEHAFPELATTLALAGTQTLVIPSAVPIGYEYLLTLRTRARAQDNQMFAVACNLTGGGFTGHSLIVDPAGNVLASAGPEETALRARLDLDLITRERNQEPALSMRQADLYRPEAVDRLGVVTAGDK